MIHETRPLKASCKAKQHNEWEKARVNIMQTVAEVGSRLGTDTRSHGESLTMGAWARGHEVCGPALGSKWRSKSSSTRTSSACPAPSSCHTYAALSNPALLTLRIGCSVASSTGARRACLYRPVASLISIS